MGELPEGLRGRILAVLLLVTVIAAFWIGVAAPLLQWHDARNDQIERDTALLRRMRQVAAELPALRRQATSPDVATPIALLEGATDSVAGAALQQRLQQIGTAAGASFASTEVLPGQQIGAYRRIGVRLSVVASWPVVVRLVESISTASPRMLVDELQIQSARATLTDSQPPLDTSMIVFGFRAGAAS